MRDIFTQKIKDFDIGNEKIAVAVSGGADSMALTLLAAELENKIVALTVDHGLREESKYEAEQVARWLGARGVEHYIMQWEDNQNISNIQADARNARYNLMAKFCQNNGIKYLVVAHNKEDQAETVLMRVMRGSGVDGLSGIAPKIENYGITIVRPLLDVSKKELKQYLRDNRQGWIEDPSNDDLKFKRVEVRKFIENSDDPELLVNRLAQTAKNMQRSRSYIEQKIAEDVENIFKNEGEGKFSIDINEFKELHEEVAYKLLAKLILTTGKQEYKPRFEKLENLYNKLISEDKFSGCTLGGCRIHGTQNGEVVIEVE